MKGIAAALVAGLLLATATTQAATPEPSGISDIVRDQFETVANGIRSAGLPRGATNEFLAKLDAARHAAIAGNARTAMSVLDALRGGLELKDAPVPLREDLAKLRAFVVFEGLFGPIPEALAAIEPFPIQVQLLDWALTDVNHVLPDAIADACIAVIFPVASPPFSILAPGSGDEKPALDEQTKRAIKEAVKPVLDDIKSSLTGGGGSGTSGQTGGGTSNGGTKSGNTTVTPRCEFDAGSIGSGGLLGGVTSAGVGVTHTFSGGSGVRGTLSGSLDITNPGGAKGWRASAGLDLDGDRFKVRLGVSADSAGARSVFVGVGIQF